MNGIMLKIQVIFNRWFENLLLEDRYRYLARRGGFEEGFNSKLAFYRSKKKYGAVRLAYSEARYEHLRTHLGDKARSSARR